MKRSYKKVILFLSILFILSEAVVASTDITGNTASTNTVAHELTSSNQVIASPASPNMQLIKDVCPSMESLILNPANQTWSAPKGWKTTQPSFLRQIDTFLGAQWVGVSVGQVICLYTLSGKDTFPVTLQRGLLVPEPTSGGLWSADKGGYRECKTNDIQNCPFYVQIPKPVQNIYEELDSFKDKTKTAAQQ